MKCHLQRIALHYEQVGEGRPILMLHGGYLDHRHMMSCMEPLFEERPGWRRIYPDMPGHGTTAAAEWIQSLEDVLHIIMEFIDVVAPAEHLVVAGMSRGGYLARGLIHKRAEMIDGVLLDTPAIVGSDDEAPLPARSILARESDLDSHVNEREAKTLDSMAVLHTFEVVRRIRKDMIPAFKLADEIHHKRILENYKFSFDQDMRSNLFDKPALFLLGRQDSIVGYEDAWNVLSNFPRATFVILDQAGHLLQMEQSQLFRALASDWLDRVEQFGGASHQRGLEHIASLAQGRAAPSSYVAPESHTSAQVFSPSMP